MIAVWTITFQSILIALFAVLLASSVWRLATGVIQRVPGLLQVAVLTAALGASIEPNSLTRTARSLGIGRGTDLLLYCAVVAMLIGFWLMYLRLHKLRSEITSLVRHLALLEENAAVSAPQDSNRKQP